MPGINEIFLMVVSCVIFYTASGFLFRVTNHSINLISAATTIHPPARIQSDVLVEVPHDVKKFLPPTKLMKRKIQHARRQQKGPMDENIEVLEVPKSLNSGSILLGTLKITWPSPFEGGFTSPSLSTKIAMHTCVSLFAI